MEYFIDERYPFTTVPKSLLIREYAQKIFSGDVNPVETSFKDYIAGCKTTNGGTLEETPKPVYRVFLRTILARPCDITADSMESALKEAHRMLRSGEIYVSYNDYAGTECLPCCSMCGDDFEAVSDLHEVCGGALVLCDRCLEEYKKEYGLEECK